jgi:hypothetical protein
MRALLRVVSGGAVLWCLIVAAQAAELPRVCELAAAAILGLTLWRPEAGLLLAVGLAPAGALFTPAPARVAELFAWALVAGWLLAVWRPLSNMRWPRAITVPAALYSAAAFTSWLSMTIAGAGGVPQSSLALFVLGSIPTDYLVLSSAEPQTWALLQSLTGVAIFLAAVGMTRGRTGVARAVAAAIVVSIAILAVGTLFEVARQWSEAGFGAWFLLRYVQGERYSLHLADLNAAGSLYVLAGLAATAFVVFDRDRRTQWLGLLAVMIPAFWLTGSRSSAVAAVGGLLVLAAAKLRWKPTRSHVVAAAVIVVVVSVAGALVADWRTDVRGSAGRAVSLRSQFIETTARMFATSPIYGVGIGRYFDRSAEFMSDELRALYGNENAHNYFAQQFAELGIAGGALFIWMIAAVIAGAWRSVGESSDEAAIGLFAATVGYLLTCTTGHPLLVPEAAIPFWAAFGSLAALTARDVPASGARRWAAAAVVVVLLGGVGRSMTVYADAAEPPSEQGFHEPETAEDGTRFRWMTRHGVTYIPDGAGFLRLTVRTPDQLLHSLVIETSVGGRLVDRRTLPAGSWVTYDVAVRQRSPVPFRRVDLRVNQQQTQNVTLGRRAAQRPVAVMLAEGTPRWLALR